MSVEDTTPLIAVVPLAARIAARRRRLVNKFVESILEADSGLSIETPVYLVKDPVLLRCDTAIFYTDLAPTGTAVTGTGYADLCRQLVQNELPALDPEMAEYAELPVDQVISSLVSNGYLVGVFGRRGVVNQVMDVSTKFTKRFDAIERTFSAIGEMVGQIIGYAKMGDEWLRKQDYFAANAKAPIMHANSFLDA